MRRHEFEHVVRAAGKVTGEDELLAIGSQSIHGPIPEGLPKDAVLSAELDLAALDDPTGEKANMIAGAIGEMSDFAVEFNYYADGVEIDTARFPQGWRDRLIPVKNENTNWVTAWCPEPHDLCVSKLLAGRDKDFKYVRALLISGHVKPEVLLERLSEAETDAWERKRILAWVIGVRPPRRDRRYKKAIRLIEASFPQQIPPVSVSVPRSSRGGPWVTSRRGDYSHLIQERGGGGFRTACGRLITMANAEVGSPSRPKCRICIKR